MKDGGKLILTRSELMKNARLVKRTHGKVEGSSLGQGIKLKKFRIDRLIEMFHINISVEFSIKLHWTRQQSSQILLQLD